ncbi:hypothetical protein PAXRUDRAFT_166498, partial [Paxillus rubicundulus Ve08.2h10]
LPGTIQEAYAGPDADHWKSAVEEELLNLNSNHVYKTVPILEGVTLITSKPIFHIKHDHIRNVEHYKVHIVAQGFTHSSSSSALLLDNPGPQLILGAHNVLV